MSYDSIRQDTVKVLKEYVEESEYAGGFVPTMHPEELVGDVLLYGFHSGHVMDLGVLEYWVQRLN